MPGSVFPIQMTFARGETTPYVQGRADIDHYQMSLAECINWWILPFGGLERRSGTRFVASVKFPDKPTRLIEYEFSTEQTYIIELGDFYARFYSAGGQIQDPPGTPVEVATPWSADEVFNIDYSSTGDVIFMTVQGHPMQELTRVSETNWTLTEHVTEDGPFLPDSFAGVSVSVNGTCDYVPHMTSNSSGGATASDSGGTGNAFRAFNRQTNSPFTLPGVSGWVRVDRGSQMRIEGYSLIAGEGDAAEAPITWSFEGSNDGSTWTVLHTVARDVGWTRGERRDFTLDTLSAPYQWIRLSWTAVNGGLNTELGELRVKAEPAFSALQVTASATDGINGGQGFLASDVGRHIRLQASDAAWRWGIITARNSDVQVVAEFRGPVFPSIGAGTPLDMNSWRLGAWSEYTGWPSKVQLWKNRLYTAASDQEPLTVWGTALLTVNIHAINNPVLATDAINVQIIDGQSARIEWLNESYRALLVSSDAKQRSITAADGGAISATNIDQNSETNYKASPVKPLSIGNTTIFADKARRRMREFGLAPDIDGYRGPDLTLISEHMFRAKITQTAFQEDPYPIIYSAIEDGRMPAMTYEPDQQIAGNSQFQMGGTSLTANYGLVRSTATISNAEGDDEVWVIVEREINGATTQYVEYVAPRFNQTLNGQLMAQTAAPEDVIYGDFFDSSIRYSGPPITGVPSGYEHLVGETVGILADGLDIGDAVVDASGGFEFPEGFEASEMVAGLRYQSRAVTLRAPRHGNQDGSGFGRMRHVGEITVDVLNTGHLEAGTFVDGKENLQDVVLRPTSDHLGDPTPLETGFVVMPDVDDTNDNEGVMILVTDKGLPAVVRSIQSTLKGEP